MAATEKKNIWFHSSDDGIAPVTKNVLMAASQGIYMPGAPAYICTSGTAKRCATSASSSTDSWSGFLLDTITAEHAANDVVKMSMINTRCNYAIYVETSGTDAAATQAMVGDNGGLTVSATTGQIGYTTYDTGNAYDAVTVQDLMYNLEPSKFALTDAPGVLIVKFMASAVNVEKA